MKRIALFCIAFLMPLLSIAQKDATGIVFDETVYNFQKINENQGRVTHIFQFTNNGSSAAVLKSVRASCGCTTPSWTKSPIEPGTKGEIAVTYNPLNRPGNFNKSITVVVENGEKKQETFTLNITGEVIKEKYTVKIGDLSLEKQNITFKEILQTKGILNDSIEVYNNSTAPLTVATGKLPKYLRIQLIPNKPMVGQKSNLLYPGQTGKLNIKYDTRKSTNWGVHTDSIPLVLNGKTFKEKSQQLQIFANLKEDFSQMTAEEKQKAPIAELSKNRISFGKIKKDKNVSVSISLKNAGLSTLHVRSINTYADYVTAYISKKDINAGEQAELKIEIQPADLPEITFTRRIEVVTNDHSVPFQYITIDWTVIP